MTTSNRGPSKRGFRGEHSPTKTMSDAARATLDELLPRAEREARYLIELRYPAYIGGGKAPDAVLSVDGAIFAMIFDDGRH